ncbi:MAG: 2-oxoglutarate dehydrogenase E1 component [Bdellovibrionales bacterium]|nr:2-oxoglutarate dehydrogenase E1 component [Bdellovibrionales bacterium]
MNAQQIIREQFGPNSAYILELFEQYQRDPSLVGGTWSAFFTEFLGRIEGLAPVESRSNTQSPNSLQSHTNGHSAPIATDGYYKTPAQGDAVQERIYRMISAFRGRGHLKAAVNPLTQGIIPLPQVEDIQVEFYHFSEDQLDKEFNCSGLGKRQTMKLRDIIQELHRVYCGSIGFEFTHLLNQEERLWLQSKIEGRFQNGYRLSREQKLHRLQKIIEAEAFESELHRKYVGHKRFSLQGVESLIPMLDNLLEVAGESGVEEVVFGMPHRGRLNVLSNTLAKPLESVFSEFEDQNIYTALGSGDVKYHMGYESKYTTPRGDILRLQLAPNPSHLEFVDPVVTGICRAIQDSRYGGERTAALPVLLHGDAAFAGQGVVFETLNMSLVAGYTTGGTIHVIVNNQIGFTTNPNESRSSTYCSDMAKAVQTPIFHVNGEDVEAACWAIRIALEFRNRYGRDVVIDLYGYRKYGHNEGDDPSFTQPVSYKEIQEKKTIATLYKEQLIGEGVIEEADYDRFLDAYRKRFDAAHEAASDEGHFGEMCAVHGRLKNPSPETGVPFEDLERIARTLIEYPKDFVPHPKLKKILEKRVETLLEDSGIEWGFAEALAFGSLQLDGCSVRLSGQDCGRGTFSQRHLALNHFEKDGRYYPLASLSEEPGVGHFEVVNSTLSEASVLGFEFGYSTIQENCLVLWEAQFGDFANGAQVIIDQFISSSEAKWNQRSGVVLLLPHGYEGQGPEHSSARLERYLQLCAEGNMFVCYPSSAAQYFHLLRRQGLLKLKRPVIIMTPKSLLRLARAGSKVDELTMGGFQTIIEETIGSGELSDTTVFLSGKVYYDVQAELEKHEDVSVRVVRIEQLYPFADRELEELIQRTRMTKAVWVQEEPQNMGAWSHIHNQFKNEFNLSLHYCGRPASASTATGSASRHAEEQRRIITTLLALVQRD